MIFSLSIFTLLSVVAAAFAQTGLEIASYFREHLSADSAIFLPSESGYTLLTTQRFNTFSGPTYVVSVKPTTDLDVQKIVSLFDPSKSQLGETHPTLSLTHLKSDPIRLLSQHIFSRHRRRAWLLGKSRFRPERY